MLVSEQGAWGNGSVIKHAFLQRSYVSMKARSGPLCQSFYITHLSSMNNTMKSILRTWPSLIRRRWWRPAVDSSAISVEPREPIKKLCLNISAISLTTALCCYRNRLWEDLVSGGMGKRESKRGRVSECVSDWVTKRERERKRVSEW